ncbi:MAG: EscU/YscU/HrcU family type III secretion system export apparatus switch protein [Lachnospiraceae bacterium]|nr:EscU/YscU/HrcU family type III secretion system export apparatus switch protein [Lachnospiraceae bacterium]
MSEFKNLLSKKAAALKYDPDQNGAPIVVASGMGHMAERITETAMQAGVPIYEDDSLATLLTQLELGSEIPEELYQAVVEIYLYFLGFTGDEVSGTAKEPLNHEESKVSAGPGDLPREE